MFANIYFKLFAEWIIIVKIYGGKLWGLDYPYVEV